MKPNADALRALGTDYDQLALDFPDGRFRVMIFKSVGDGGRNGYAVTWQPVAIWAWAEDPEDVLWLLHAHDLLRADWAPEAVDARPPPSPTARGWRPLDQDPSPAHPT